MTRFWIKLLLDGIILFPLILWFSDATWWEAAVVTVLLTAAAYFVGDRWILRATNNIIAALADFGLVFVLLWAAAAVLDWALLLSEIFIVALLVGLVEYVFHMYLGYVDRTGAAAR